MSNIWTQLPAQMPDPWENAMKTVHDQHKLIADLVEALEDALEFMEGYEDVVDGSYGVPAPNKAMQVCTQIRSALARAKT